MKKNLLLILILFTSSILVANESLDRIETLYKENNFREIISILEKESTSNKEEGKESAEVYYNLGNAYYRTNNIAKAILNYEKGLLINPGDNATKENLELSRTKIADKFAEKDSFFLLKAIEWIQNITNSDNWSRLAIFSFVVVLSCIGLFSFSKKETIKKITFYVSIFFIFVLICANIFAYRQKSKVKNRNTAIVMQANTPAYISPNSSEEEKFSLNPGSKIIIKKTDGNWVEVEIISGETGWISKDNIEII